MFIVGGKRLFKAAVLAAFAFAPVSIAQAQSTEPRWSADIAFGIDNGISGNINSSGIGRINDQAVVVLKNTYDEVYGTGLHFRFGGGYMLDETTEARATFTFQSLDADFVVPMGDIGVSNLYAQYTDYQTFLLDFGLRRYMTVRPAIRLYGEGTIGLGFVDKTDVVLVAPGANLIGENNDFYDQTAAFTVGINAGALIQANDRTGVFVQLGLRFVSGMTEIDDLIGTGLDSINDKSSRWTLPFVTGVRFRF
jgi:hypothetical protein